VCKQAIVCGSLERDVCLFQVQLGHLHLFSQPVETRPSPVEVDESNTIRIAPEAITLTARGDCKGGGSGREFLENLHNSSTEQWDKWYDAFTPYDGSWVLAKLKSPTPVACFGLMSANDCPHRDPASWKLTGKLAGSGKWVTLHVQKTCPFTERFQWQWYSVDPKYQVGSGQPCCVLFSPCGHLNTARWQYSTLTCRDLVCRSSPLVGFGFWG
jgi:hypothetical protein